MKSIYYILALFFYHFGDKCWLIISHSGERAWFDKTIGRLLWWLYQKSMDVSIRFDEKAGFRVWKLPDE